MKKVEDRSAGKESTKVSETSDCKMFEASATKPVEQNTEIAA